MLHVSVTWVDKKAAHKCKKLWVFLHIVKTAFDPALPQLCTIMLPILGDWLTFGRFGDFFWSNLVSSHGQLYPQHEILQHNFLHMGLTPCPTLSGMCKQKLGRDRLPYIYRLAALKVSEKLMHQKRQKSVIVEVNVLMLEMIEIVGDPTSATPCTCWLSRSSLQTLIHCSQRWLSMQSTRTIDGFQSMHKIRDGFQCIFVHCIALACL